MRSRAALTLLLVAASACATEPRTRRLAGDLDGARKAVEIAAAQPSSYEQRFSMMLAPEPAPEPTVRYFRYGRQAPEALERLCAWAAAPPGCSPDEALLDVVWLDPSSRITHYSPDADGLEAAWAAESADGGVVLAAIPWRRIDEEEAVFSRIWKQGVFDDRVVCADFRCYARKDAAAVAVVRGQNYASRTLTVSPPEEDPQAEIHDSVYFRVIEYGEHERGLVVSEVFSLDETQLCGRMYEEPITVEVERCAPTSEIRRLYVEDQNRNLAEVAVDGALFPLKVVTTALVYGAITAVGAAEGRGEPTAEPASTDR